MAVEYNLVVLGDGPVARYAAEYARSLNARVALVVGMTNPSPWSYPSGKYTDTLVLQALRHISHALPTYRYGPYYEPARIDAPFDQSTDSKLQGSRLLSCLQTLVARQWAMRSLDDLEQLGIDVVYANDLGDRPLTNGMPWEQGTAEFTQEPSLHLKAGFRVLPSQAYLLALDGEPLIPPIPGISDCAYDTLDTFWHTFWQDKTQDEPPTPSSVLIVSDNHQGLETAYVLGTFGIEVTVVMDGECGVGDCDAQQWIVEALAAVGVNLLWSGAIVRLEQADGGIKAHITLAQPRDRPPEERPPEDRPPRDKPPGDKPPEESPGILFFNQVFIAMGRQVDFSRLQLGAVGVAYDAGGIRVNEHFKSNHPLIFASGDAIGGHTALNQWYSQVAIAVQSALFNKPLWNNAWLANGLLRGLTPWLTSPAPVVPATLPNLINITPPLAYIGYGEAEARQRYGGSGQHDKTERLTVLRQSYESLDQAQLLGAHTPLSTMGWCKMMVLENGQIVGAYVWGVQAEEVIGAIALAMQNSIPMEELGQLGPPMPSITAELLQSLALQWKRERIKQRSLLFDWLELFFNWQRDWTK